MRASSGLHSARSTSSDVSWHSKRNGKIVVAGSAGDDYGQSIFAAARFVERD
jgi:hypothetical protein